MNSSTTSDNQPLLGEGGLSKPVPAAADPFMALDDLMQVVEALCPKWPEREPFREGTSWKL
jgi:hypothetical protein